MELDDLHDVDESAEGAEGAEGVDENADQIPGDQEGIDTENEDEGASEDSDDSDAGATDKDEKDEKDEEDSGEGGELSGIEQYLSQFDIEGGMIQFDDGSSTHFNELDAGKQAEVLSQLHGTSAKSVEEKYGLDEGEINLINHLRENNKSVDEFVNELATKRVEAVLAMQSADSVDYEKMEADAVYTAFLKNSDPEATAEDIEKGLEAAKALSNYEKVVGNLRSQFKRDQDIQASQAAAQQQKEMTEMLEGQRKQVVEAVTQLQDVDGFSVDDGMKNSVLDTILSVDKDGDSMFMTEVFSDPENLFKAAFWYKNGADIIKAKEAQWKKEKSEAFRRGQNSAKNGKISFSSKGSDDETTPDPGGTDDSIDSWDNIHS